MGNLFITEGIVIVDDYYSISAVYGTHKDK